MNTPIVTRARMGRPLSVLNRRRPSPARKLLKASAVAVLVLVALALVLSL